VARIMTPDLPHDDAETCRCARAVLLSKREIASGDGQTIGAKKRHAIDVFVGQMDL
jgi:hypothetical protein